MVGGGTDTLTLTGTVTKTLVDFANVSNVETLTTATGDDTLDLTSGTNSFVTIDTGAGDDRVKLAASNDIWSGKTIDGGANTATGDTLEISGVADLSAGTVINFENIITDSNLAMTVEQYNGFTTIDVAGNDLSIVGNGTDNIMSASKIINEAASSQIIVSGLTTATTINDVDLDIDASSAGANITLVTTNIDGLSVTTGAQSVSVDASAMTTNKTLNITGTDATGTVNVTLANDTNLNATTAAAVSVTDGSGNNVITTGSNADTINLTAGGTDNVNAGAGDDTINIDASNIALGTISGEAGADTYNITQAGTYTGTLDGGTQTDTLNIAAAGVDISGLTLTSIETLVITNPGALTLTDNQVSSIGAANISGTGTITVLIDSDSSLEMTPMSVTTTNVIVTANSIFTGTFESGSAISVDDGATLSADYGKLTGFSVNQSGTTGAVHITIPSASTTADLSTVGGSASQTAEFTGSQTFTGNLNSVVTSIVDGATITTAADKATGQTVNVQTSGTGTDGILAVTIINLAGQNNADLTTIAGDAFASVTVNADVTFTGTLDDTVATTVATGNTLTVADTIVTGKSVIGAGSATVTIAASSAIDLSSINVSGTETVAFTADSTFTGNLADTDAMTITGATTDVILADTVITTKTLTLSGDGTLTVNATSGATVDLSNITNNLTGTLTVNDAAGNEIITGTSNADTINLTAGGTDNVNAGAGDDTINVTQDFVSVDGGTNVDTLNINATLTPTGTISNIETINIEGTADLSGKIDSIVSSINIGATNDVGLTLTGADLNTETNSINVNDTGDSLTINSAQGNNYSNISITGTSSQVTMNVDGVIDLSGLTVDSNIGQANFDVVGSANNDNFTVDFSNLGNLNVDGGVGSDKLITNNGTLDLSTGNVGLGLNATNIETLDIKTLNLSGGDGNGTAGNALEISDADINNWTEQIGASSTLQLDITSVQASEIELNDGGAVSVLGNTTAGSYTYTFADSTVLNYTIA